MQEKGVISKINKDHVIVQTQLKSTCESCAANSSCGAGIIAKALAGKTQNIGVKSDQSFAIGQQVTLQVDSSTVLSASFWVYMVPIFCFIAGALFCSWLSGLSSSSEGLVILGAIISGFIGFKISQMKLTKNANILIPTIKRN